MKDNFMESKSRIVVSRPSLSNEAFHEIYERNEKTLHGVCSQFQRWMKSQAYCSGHRFWAFVIGFFPVLSWLPKYKKKYVAGDLIAGWTVGIIRIPQGMAYGLLAGVHPVYGLYSCFFPVLLWFVFSTSKHTSVGTMAVVCLMIRNLIDKYVPDITIAHNDTHLLINGQDIDLTSVKKQYIIHDEYGNPSLNSSSYLDDLLDEREDKKIQIACSITLLVGIIQVLMAVLRLGFLTTLLSDPVIQGFTTGSAFHVATSQVEYMFGLGKHVDKYSGPLSIFKTLGDIFSHLGQSNVPDVVISVISVPALLGAKYINERYKRKLHNIPIPIELILVILATTVSHFCHLSDPPYNVNTVKHIPTGFPTFTPPAYTGLWGEMVSDCLIMAFISVAISLSLTKIYSDKHGYEVDANQEILALGICNTLPAFLSSFAVAASLSRTAIQESTGGKTQLVSVLSSVLMFIVLLWLAPLFEPVPKSVLACIIIVALKSLFQQFEKLKGLFHVSIIDFCIWIATCFGVILLGVDLGLAVGIAVAIAALIFRIQHPKHAVLGRIMHTELYADHTKYRDAEEIAGIKIFHYADSVSFTNRDAFRTSLYSAVGCNPTIALNKEMKRRRKRSSAGLESERRLLSSPDYATSRLADEDRQDVRRRSSLQTPGRGVTDSILGFQVLIFDATMWSFIDSTAAREILQIVDKFKALGVAVLLAGASSSVLKSLDCSGLPSRITHSQVFVTVHDAVVHAEKLIQRQLRRNSDDFEESVSSMPGYPGFDALAL